MSIGEWRQRMADRWAEVQDQWEMREQGSWLLGAVILLVLALLVLGWYWSREPKQFRVVARPAANGEVVPGLALAETSSKVAYTLLDKRGGYIRNDRLPPGVFMDNMPAWELGVVHQLRDISRALHRDMSLSHAIYVEDRDLALAEPQFNVSPDSWLLPSTESEYRRGADALSSYAARLAKGAGKEAQFYPRADNLRRWLADVDVSLGRLSTRLNAALPGYGLVLAGDGSDGLPVQEQISWMEVDDVFYEARGSSWALIHLLKAAEIDFAEVLERRDAVLSLRAAIHELEATQQKVWSPVILNGSGFGIFANHSLVMANYLSRAQTDLKDVAALLVE